MWLIKVFSAICLTTVCAAQDDGEDVTTMDQPQLVPTAAPTIFVPPVPSPQLQSTWSDVFPSEKVELRCSVTGSSDWTFTWSKDGKDVQNTDPNASLNTDGSVLTITAADQTYSGSYTCKGQHKARGVSTADSNALKLTVQEPPVPSLQLQSTWSDVFPSEKVEFRCSVTGSSDWTFTWSRDGKDVQNTDPNASLASDGSVLTITAADQTYSGSYTCKGQHKARGVSTADSNALKLTVQDLPKPSLRLATSWRDVFENETVGFRCEIDISDWTFTWYKNQQELLMVDDTLLMDSEGGSFNITPVTKSHQGGYTCKAHHQSRGISSGFSNTVDVTVYDNVPIPSLSKNPGLNPMYVGETVNFTCKVDLSSGWEYQWYKDGKTLTKTGKTISIHLSTSDRGKYSCRAARGETLTNKSEEVQQDVIEIPVPSLKKVTRWLDVFPDESVKLNCEMSGSSGWIYTWYKDGQKVQANDVVSFDPNGATLSINSSSAAHAGQYKCNGHLNGRSVHSSDSSELTLTVYDKKPSVTLTQDPDYRVMFSGESVSFSCHINVSSGWEYLWYKDDQSLTIPGNKYTISPIGATDKGLYKCEARRGPPTQAFTTAPSRAISLEVEANKPKPLMTQQPNDLMVYTGEPVSFECKVELSSGWQYVWYKDRAQVPVYSSRFSISDANSFNSGSYKCMATRSKTKYNTSFSDEQILHISEIPVPSLTNRTPWLDVFPAESVTLSCDMDGTSNWRYTWYKDEKQVKDAVSFDSNGATLTISSASASHRGQYSCSATLKTRPVNSNFSSGLTLSVYDRKPTVTLIQSPEYNVMHTGDSVSFNCHINVSSGWEYLWYKDDGPIPESGNNHTIASVLRHHSGQYKCQTKRKGNTDFLSNKSQNISLDIQERPQANIVLLTGWSEVFSTDSLVLKCGVEDSKDKWNYTWFKADQEIEMVLSEKHTVTPQNDPDQSLYQCKGIRNGRPSYSKTSDHLKTKNLLLKRRILLSISGCIVFGIAAVFLGCIVLRVIRKPARDEYKPEEADLFLSMAQLKDRDDAPCPLVEYITDAALNSSPKEEEENGTICSETTPLPITSQEDQAAATESGDAKEENGGLVSFKQ